ncbi:MAG: hypothetical protein ABI338_02290 [Gemmatimonadaceae bacterium]
MPRRRFQAAILALAAALCTSPASAQAVSGLGDDAGTPPAGSIRIKIESDWSYFDQLFASPTAGAAGLLKPLGARYSFDSVGVAQLPILKPVQDTLRAITGVAGLNVSLGKTVTQVTDRMTSIPVSLEAGVSRWLSIKALVPIVETRTNVFFRANPGANEANLGPNPAASGDAVARATDSIFASQMVSAATAVRAYCSGSGASDPQCTGATALATSATGLGNSLASLYMNGAFVPTRGSTVQSAVDARIASVRGSLNAFAANPATGVPAVTATGVVGASTPLATPGLQQVLSDPAFGVGLQPFQTIQRTHLGDAEVTAKLLLFDSFYLRNMSRFEPTGVNARLAVAAGYRFPTGALPAQNALTDIASGTHAGAVLLRGYLDVMLGGHFWVSTVARYAKSTSDTMTLRYDPGVAFPSASSAIGVQRTLGNFIQLEATPRWVFNDFVSIGGQYLYTHKSQDSYTTGGTPLPILESGSDYTEKRVGGGIVFSNLHAVTQGKSRFPFEVSYMHSETIGASGGAVPKLITDGILIRLYWHLKRQAPAGG